jgi:hypothetical protein
MRFFSPLRRAKTRAAQLTSPIRKRSSTCSKGRRTFPRLLLGLPVTQGLRSRYGIGTPQLWRTMDGAEAYFVDDEGGVLAPILGKPQKDKN